VNFRKFRQRIAGRAANIHGWRTAVFSLSAHVFVATGIGRKSGMHSISA